MQHNEKRTYQRGEHFQCTAQISEDEKKWFTAPVTDLSSGGLSFKSEQEYENGTIFWFDISVDGFFAEFHVKVQGKVRRVHHTGTHYAHGVQFIGLDQDTKIRIDENVLRIKRLGTNPSDALINKL